MATLEDAWNRAQSKLSQIRAALSSTATANPRIVRVGQLDSELLDQELANLLQDPIIKALSLISPSFRSRFEPELDLLIKLSLYKLSIWNTGATYGAKLQDLRYVVPDTSSTRLAPSNLPRNTLLLHATLSLVLPYFHNRFRIYALSHAWPDAPSSDSRRKTWETLVSAESVYALAGLLNFIAFLWEGRYRTLTDRLLRMSLVPARRLVKRDVSYEFMNRQMVWHAFTEFLLFLLPLINARTLRRKLLSIVSSIPTALQPFRNALNLPKKAEKTRGTSTKRGKYWLLPQDQCAICVENSQFNLTVSEPSNLFRPPPASITSSSSDEPVATTSDAEPPACPIYNPYQTSCRHIYCYHCVAEQILRTADEVGEVGWECIRCGQEVKEAHRYVVDNIEGENSESDYEFSSDLDISTDLSGSMGSFSESGFSE